MSASRPGQSAEPSPRNNSFTRAARRGGRLLDAVCAVLALVIGAGLTAVNASVSEPLTMAPLYAIPVGLVAFRFGYASAAVSGAAATALILLSQPHQIGSTFFDVLVLSITLTLVVAMFAARLGLDVAAADKGSGLDASTGLASQRAMIGAVAMELARCERYSRPLSVILVGLDLPKKVDHSTATWLTRQVGWLIEEDLREIDVVGAFGGTALLVILPETPRENGLLVGERLRGLVNSHVLTLGKGSNAQQITVSIGVVGHPEDSSSAEGLLEAAEEALFAAQAAGGNTVRLARKLQVMGSRQQPQDAHPK